MTEAWHGTGYEESQRLAAESERKRQVAKKGKRFWLDHKIGDSPQNPRNEAAVIMIGGVRNEAGEITSSPFTWWEHNLKIGGSYKGNWFTCTRSMGGCPFCDADPNAENIGRYFCGGYTIIDTSRWEDRDNNLHFNEKVLLVAKSQMLTIFNKKEEIRGNMCKTKWHVFRSGDKKASIGDQWEFIEGDVDLSAILDPAEKPVDCSPIDYMDILKPVTEEQAKEILSRWRPGEAAGSFQGGHGTKVDYKK